MEWRKKLDAMRGRRIPRASEADLAGAPIDKRPEALEDIAGDGGGQMNQVGVPWSGEGKIRRGQRSESPTGKADPGH